MGQAKITEAYCYELNKVLNTEQARAAFFSSENTEYSKFNFYCFCCGIKYKTRNIQTKQRIDLTKHNTPHFAIKETGGRHTSPLCEHLNDNPKESKPSKGSAPTIEEEFFHSHFLTTPITSGIIHGLSNAPDRMDEEILQKAPKEMADYNAEQTSIFEDIIRNYLKLKQLNQMNNHKLKIDDSFQENTTYQDIFLKWQKIGYFYQYSKKQHYFNYKIFYGKIKNSYLKDTGTDWNFIIDYDKEYFMVHNRKVISRVIFPLDLLNKNLPTKNFFNEQKEKKRLLDMCYLVATVPDLVEVKNDKNDDTHLEAIFVIKNLNHIVITFSDLNESLNQ